MKKKEAKLKSVTIEDIKNILFATDHCSGSASPEALAAQSESGDRWEKRTLKRIDKDIIKTINKRDKKVAKGKTEDIGGPSETEFYDSI